MKTELNKVIKFAFIIIAMMPLVLKISPALGQTELSRTPADDMKIRRELASEIVMIISGANDSESAINQIPAPYFDRVMRQGLADRKLDIAEKKYPGIAAAISKTISPIIHDRFISEYPALREIQIIGWAEKLSAPDLSKAIRFFKTPMMKKLAAIALNSSNDDFSEYGKNAMQLTALQSITEADIADFETNKDFDQALADSIKSVTDAWDIQRLEWIDRLINSLADEIKIEAEQVVAMFIKKETAQ